MNAWELPGSVEVGGVERPVRTDFRACLDVLTVMSDAELADDERGYIALSVFYPGFDDLLPGDWQEAIEKMEWFLRGGGAEERGNRPKLADWAQDFPLIIGPVNRVLGYEARQAEDLHWWTFLAAYAEIGDCMFAQVVSIRKKLKTGKKLDKSDRQFYRENRELVDFHAPVPAGGGVPDEWIV